jgi:hypothetical protein
VVKKRRIDSREEFIYASFGAARANTHGWIIYRFRDGVYSGEVRRSPGHRVTSSQFRAFCQQKEDYGEVVEQFVFPTRCVRERSTKPISCRQGTCSLSSFRQRKKWQQTSRCQSLFSDFRELERSQEHSPVPLNFWEIANKLCCKEEK